MIWDELSKSSNRCVNNKCNARQHMGRVGDPARAGETLASKSKDVAHANGGDAASPGRKKSTRPLPPRPTSNTSMTSLTRTRKVRVAGPFTVESLSPHRGLAVDENDDLIET